jgi:hypothetical protein
MSAPVENAFVEQALSTCDIASLASLYDRFAHSFDPFSKESEEAEHLFNKEVATLYDYFDPKDIRLHDFRKAVILKCKRHLRANDNPPTV